ncbi:MAG: aminopeptidase P family protein [Clostridiales bacterium]|nr:aminopeptidase P family protein [Clostridiales bacterium]
MKVLSRQEELRRILRREGLEAFLTVDPIHRYYLSGFRGSEGTLLLLPEETVLLVDGRYTLQAREQAPHTRVVEYQRPQYGEELRKALREAGVEQVAVESRRLTHAFFLQLEAILSPEIGVEPREGLVEGLRRKKDEEELFLLRQAFQLADEGFRHILSFIRPGVTEREVALELEFFMRRQGAEGAAFPFIVASGSRGALPHGLASGKVLEEGELVTLDFGCRLEGYHSDITRTVAVKRVSEEQRQVYEAVREAGEKALSLLQAGVSGKEADEAARAHLREKGYGEAFRHSLGHGVGLEVHEAPSLSFASTDILEDGMVVTVEPGVYLEGRGGVRIEDAVIIRPGGYELLTLSPKELLIVG